MKALKPLFGFALLGLALGCEFHVSSCENDDCDIDFSDFDAATPVTRVTATAKVSAEPSASNEETDAGTSTSPSTSATPVTTDGGASSVASSEASASAIPVATSTAAPATSMSMLPAKSYLCSAPSTAANEAALCDQCLEKKCKMARAACCGTNCETLWPAIQQCMTSEAPFFDPAQDYAHLDECIAKAAPSDPMLVGSDTMEINDVLNCVNQDDPSSSTGSGTCTVECYGVLTLMQ